MLRDGRTNMWKEEKMDVNEANIKKMYPRHFHQTETLTQKLEPHTYKIIQNEQERRINNFYGMLRPVI